MVRMRSFIALVVLLVVVLALPAVARADAPPAPRGFAVLALAGATDVAWPLAKDVYASAALRPAALDEAHARVLAGEAPAAGASQELTDLAASRAAVHGDDAPSRQILAGIARDLHVRGVIVVDPGASSPKSATARVFLADAAAFDAARYAPDDAAVTSWRGAIQSLSRAYSPPPPPAPVTPAATTAPAPAAALREGPKVENMPSGSKKFYESPWFWGALGVAAAAAAAAYFLTRDNGSDTIHLQLQAPH
jgi:hypothetical protein